MAATPTIGDKKYVILSVSEISHDLSTEKLPQKLPDNKEKNGCL